MRRRRSSGVHLYHICCVKVIVAVVVGPWNIVRVIELVRVIGICTELRIETTAIRTLVRFRQSRRFVDFYNCRNSWTREAVYSSSGGNMMRRRKRMKSSR
jgi:hypothetical protein